MYDDIIELLVTSLTVNPAHSLKNPNILKWEFLIYKSGLLVTYHLRIKRILGRNRMMHQFVSVSV